MDEAFGAVAADTNIEGTIDLTGQMNAGYAVHEMSLKVNTATATATATNNSKNNLPNLVVN
jgi:hypothetical protein